MPHPHRHPAPTTTISYPESSGFLVSGATPGRLWGHRILLPQDFCGKTMETVTEQPIKKIEFFRCPQSLPGVAPLTKKPEDSGYEIATTTARRAADSSPDAFYVFVPRSLTAERPLGFRFVSRWRSGLI